MKNTPNTRKERSSISASCRYIRLIIAGPAAGPSPSSTSNKPKTVRKNSTGEAAVYCFDPPKESEK